MTLVGRARGCRRHRLTFFYEKKKDSLLLALRALCINTSCKMPWKKKQDIRAPGFLKIKSFLLAYEAGGVVGVCGRGVSFLHGSMCAEGMGCG